MKKNWYFMILFAVIALSLSSCNKDDEQVNPVSKTYTAEEMKALLGSKTPPSNGELVLKLYNDHVSGLKSGLGALKVGWPILTKYFFELPNEEFALVSAWVIIDNGCLLEVGHIASIYSNQNQFIRNDFYIGWNSENPFCNYATINALEIQNIESLKITFTFNSNYGIFSFSQNFWRKNYVEIYLPEIDFSVSWEVYGQNLNFGGMMDFNTSTSSEIYISPGVNSNCSHFIIFPLPNGVEVNDQIIFQIFPINTNYPQDNITINITNGNITEFMTLPLVFEPGEVRYQVKHFNNGMIIYGDFVIQRAILDNPETSYYSLVPLIDISQLISEGWNYTNEVLELRNMISQIPLDPTQYQGDLNTLFSDVPSWYLSFVNIVDSYSLVVFDFIEDNGENLTYSQKEYLRQVIIFHFLDNSYKLTTEIYDVVIAYQIDTMPESWLWLINQKNNQLHELVANL